MGWGGGWSPVAQTLGRLWGRAPAGPLSRTPLPRKILSPEFFRVQLREQHLYYHDRLLPVSRVIPHPNFYAAQDGADIALLELEEPVNISSHVHPISLPPASETFPSGTPCWVTGWGNVDDGGGWPGQPRAGTGGTGTRGSREGCQWAP